MAAIVANKASYYKSFRIVPLVLVVDDDRDNLIFMASFLKMLGLKHLVAEKGQNALDLAMDKKPDLILLDIVMPEINGIETARLLKRSLLTNHIPIIAVTGLILSQHRAAIKAAGCEGYISKPLFIDQLETKITSYFNFDFPIVRCTV